MTYLIQESDIKLLDSITKYPSILTLHELDKKGRVLDTLVPTSVFSRDAILHAYEKIDGENARIIFLGDGTDIDYMIGSRKEILYTKGDRIAVSTGNIANFLKPLAERLASEFQGLTGLRVCYFEVYGGRTPNAKQYTSDKSQGARLFDVFSLNQEELASMLKEEPIAIAAWRDSGRQPHWTCNGREEFAREHNLETSPKVATLTGKDLPLTYKDVLLWLSQFTDTKVGINQFGFSEGVVVRTPDRKQVVKIRFEDYEKRFRFEEQEKWLRKAQKQQNQLRKIQDQVQNSTLDISYKEFTQEIQENN